MSLNYLFNCPNIIPLFFEATEKWFHPTRQFPSPVHEKTVFLFSPFSSEAQTLKCFVQDNVNLPASAHCPKWESAKGTERKVYSDFHFLKFHPGHSWLWCKHHWLVRSHWDTKKKVWHIARLLGTRSDVAHYPVVPSWSKHAWIQFRDPLKLYIQMDLQDFRQSPDLFADTVHASSSQSSAATRCAAAQPCASALLQLSLSLFSSLS